MLRLEDKKAAVQKEYDAIISKMWDEYETTRSQAESIAQPAEDVNQANRALGEVKGKIRALGTVNLEAIEEYEQVSQRYEFMSEQIGDVERSKTKLQQLIRDLTAQMRELFTDSFEQINRHFSQIFVELFGGGKAQLKLTEGEDVLESGIEIYVQPPGQNYQKSGGPFRRRAGLCSDCHLFFNSESASGAVLPYWMRLRRRWTM